MKRHGRVGDLRRKYPAGQFEALSARHGLDEAEIGPRERSADSGESGTHGTDSSLELR